MRKRLVKKLQNKSINKQKYELSELEELMVLAHRINKTETGCIFVTDYPHVAKMEFEICFNKTDYHDKYSRLDVRYGKNSSWNNPFRISEFKEEVIRLLEELNTKKD